MQRQSGHDKKKHKRKMVLLRKGRANFRQHKGKVNVNRKRLESLGKKKKSFCAKQGDVGHK